MHIKWAHLSDIHHMYETYKTTLLRDKLIEYLSNKKNDVDYLFITGDIADKGGQYGIEVINFLDDVVKAIEIEKKDLFMIPGNHDINRNPMAARLAKGIIDSKDAMEEINTLDEDTYEALISVQKSFFEFYKTYVGEEYPVDQLHFVKKCKGFNVVHINTCLVAGADGAEGNILIGLNRLYKTLKQIPNDGAINIALGHHTINCIHKAEKESLLHRFSDGQIDLYLNGHVHKASYHHDSNNYNDTYFFTSGSIFEDRYSDPLFITGVIDTEFASGEVIYHRWNSKGEFWHADNTIGRRTNSGSYSFEINRLKKKTDEEFQSLTIDVDDFKEFLIDFHTTLSSADLPDDALVSKDITEKFVNMSCSPTFKLQFDKWSIYFPIINKILSTTSFVGIDKKFIIPNVIITEYQNVLYSYENGDLILVHMIDNLFDKYAGKVSYSKDRLKSYLRILIFWSIYECDIFNEDKRQKDVV
ncbi:hypothetical protein PaeCFBP13512_19765 [Paenibacillus sp. CFBP13512]|uniref:metallophosphoesterase family protein n=1 Tax=Paenibacillus sp. CFBP13512 TaxID=2184007 RepID=UPI0010BF6B43|nr:metallophosphoesterase [Paenibacillus sp. CFBP13512]TKJ86073.1 hypothetical protein PaeCFBP13512_19765 [Paenibacillus sp. CFBP13512]